MKHTKEPWEHIPETRGSMPFVVTDANGEREAFYVDHSNGDQIARRIVACVNACTGISNDVLDAGAIIESDKLYAADKALDAAIRQRDELLNALKVLRNVRTTGELDWAHELADAAIEKVGAGGTAPEGHNVLADRPTALHAAGPESEANGVERRVMPHG